MAMYNDNLIALSDEEGNELQFEIVADVELDGETYVGMIEIFDDAQKMLESSGQLVVMKTVEDNSGDTIMVTLDSNEELARVVAEMEKQLEETFIIDDTEK